MCCSWPNWEPMQGICNGVGSWLHHHLCGVFTKKFTSGSMPSLILWPEGNDRPMMDRNFSVLWPFRYDPKPIYWTVSSCAITGNGPSMRSELHSLCRYSDRLQHGDLLTPCSAWLRSYCPLHPMILWDHMSYTHSLLYTYVLF